MHNIYVQALVNSAKKYPLFQERHKQLLSAAQELIPIGADVIFLGNGEFVGIELQAELTDFDWKFGCRNSTTDILYDGEEFSSQDLLFQPCIRFGLPDVMYTSQNFGPGFVIAWCRTGSKEPIFQATNFELSEKVCCWYQKRFKIETFFLAQWSRGLHLHNHYKKCPS